MVHYFGTRYSVRDWDMIKQIIGAAVAIVLLGCSQRASPPQESAAKMPSSDHASNFGADLAFLQAHTQVIVLASADRRAQVAIAPAYQGRVMTSSADGPQGDSFGYLHRPGILAGVRQPHMTVLGGEDRFWLGPEGG